MKYTIWPYAIALKPMMPATIRKMPAPSEQPLSSMHAPLDSRLAHTADAHRSSFESSPMLRRACCAAVLSATEPRVVVCCESRSLLLRF